MTFYIGGNGKSRQEDNGSIVIKHGRKVAVNLHPADYYRGIKTPKKSATKELELSTVEDIYTYIANQCAFHENGGRLQAAHIFATAYEAALALPRSENRDKLLNSIAFAYMSKTGERLPSVKQTVYGLRSFERASEHGCDYYGF